MRLQGRLSSNVGTVSFYVLPLNVNFHISYISGDTAQIV